MERDSVVPDSRTISIALVALVAPVLGGSTEPWSQGIVLVLIALAVFLNPPTSFIGRTFSVVAIAALLLGAVTLLPARWWGEPWWRRILADELGLPLSPTLSVQPWFTMEAWVLLLGGILWLLVAGEKRWNPSERRWIARAVGGGIVVLTALWLVVYYTGWRVPIWDSDRNFGPFPNRNQTGDLLGTWAVVIAACALDDFREHRWRGGFWIAGLALILWGLIVNYSRAGVLIFFFGLGAWGTVQLSRSRSLRSLAIGAAGLLVAASLFAMFGGETLERITGMENVLEDPSRDFRLLVFRDAWSMAVASPWAGIGLGNFDGLFALARSVSADSVRAIHPESDWLWLLAEMGWFGPILAAAMVALFVRRALPFEQRSASSVRSAALVGGALFALHGFVDVSGHRLGSALPGLLLFALAARAPRAAQSSRAQAVVAVGAGVVLACVGVCWIAATVLGGMLPGSIGATLANKEATAAHDEERFADVIPAATRASAWAPLDWENYFLRGVAHAYLGQPEIAEKDFLRARGLDPGGADVAFEEGRIWAYFSPPRAAAAWGECLRRAEERAPEYYRRMLSEENVDAELRTALRDLAKSDRDLVLVWLHAAPPEAAQTELRQLLDADPQLTGWTAAQLASLFGAWRSKGDRTELIRALEDNATWQSAGWRELSMAYAQEGDFESACRIVRRFQPPPTLPRVSQVSAGEAMTAFARNPADLLAGLQLHHAQLRDGSLRSALATLDQLSALPDAPKYLPWLRADLHERLGEWPAAWRALEQTLR